MSNIADREYDFICKLVYEHSRINLGDGKKELVTARLGKRLRVLDIPTYKDYCDFLQTPKGEEELTHLIDSISTNHTFFFREFKHFEFLQQTVLPHFAPKTQSQGSFKVWSAASSSGEEPYSIAISLSDYFAAMSGWKWTLDATDISTKILAKAKEGIFAEDRVKEVPQETLRKYFQKGTGKWDGCFKVKEDLISRVKFTHLNLLGPAYPFTEKFQLIFCRNVMIYFDRPTQEQLVRRLSDCLVSGGYLFVGHSESLTGIKHPLKTIKPAIYQKP